MSDLAAFHARLLKAKRILAVVGAGLSASSGLPTFRGAGGYWRNYQSTDLATPRAFARDPGLVWLFYAYRRHMALGVRPNRGHYALAELARKREFMCLSQNVDGLHARAGHPPESLKLLHGSLFTLKCNKACGWSESDISDPLCPALAPASVDMPPGELLPLLDPSLDPPKIHKSELPPCPQCREGVKRPGVVWFGESLDSDMLSDVDRWIDQDEVDIVLVIGTSAVVYPAAGYAGRARGRDTLVVTVNLDTDEVRAGDMAFKGDAAEVLPLLLEPVIGKPEAWAV